MNEVNNTLFIPLYGKAKVSRQGIILKDPAAERIWSAESFPIRGKSRSRWLAYNMAMRARVFDDWTDAMLRKHPEALVIHIGCGLDSRFERVQSFYSNWVDCDLPEVIDIRKKYYDESDRYHMMALDASEPRQIGNLPESDTAIVALEGLTMYLTNDEVRDLFRALETRYRNVRILADFYTEFGAKASRFKNPVNEVGVTQLYGIDDPAKILQGLRLHVQKEYSFTPSRLIDELTPVERIIFRQLFTGGMYRRIYRLFSFTT